MRYAAKTDFRHKAIVQALRKVGCKVTDLSRVGFGVPDLIVRVGPGRLLMMEIKEKNGKLTPDQELFMQGWLETVVVRSVEDALAAVGIR